MDGILIDRLMVLCALAYYAVLIVIASQLKRVIDETVEACYSHYPDEYRQHTTEQHHSKTQILNTATTGFTLVLESQEHIIGTGTLLDNKIEGVYIHPDHQRQGYGTRIMQALEEPGTHI